MNAVAAFVRLLRTLPRMPDTVNPWREWTPGLDVGAHAPRVRAQNLQRYLERRVGRARLLLVAEAPGFRGARWTGVPMTSERILLGGKPAVPPEAVFDGPKVRTSRPELYPGGAAEITASIVWPYLLGMGLHPDDFVLWNALPAHPHVPGKPLSNRPPRPQELRETAHVLPAFLNLFPGTQAICLGRVASSSMTLLGRPAPMARHPANGGAAAFRADMGALLGRGAL
jgi:uracil-DNA glycosylase